MATAADDQQEQHHRRSQPSGSPSLAYLLAGSGRGRVAIHYIKLTNDACQRQQQQQQQQRLEEEIETTMRTTT